MPPMPTQECASIVLYENAAPSATIPPKETVQEVVAKVVNEECKPAFVAMMTKGTIYQGNGNFGDFEFMIKNGYTNGCVYLVNDNLVMFERCQTLHPENKDIEPGGGNARIRSLKHYSNNLIVSVPTNLRDAFHVFHEYVDKTRYETEYKCLRYVHEQVILCETMTYVCIRHVIPTCKMIDVAFERIVNFFIANPSKNLLYYSRDPERDILGLGIFSAVTPEDVVLYITKKIKAVPDIVNHHRAKNAGMLGDENVSLMLSDENEFNVGCH